MPSLHLGPLAPFDTRSWKEKKYFITTLRRPWSGYLGGVHTPGYWVSRLSEEWCSTFNVKRAIPCNSATSGLLAACMAIDIKPGDLVCAPVYTMSATAACAKVLGATVRFMDINLTRYGISMAQVRESEKPKAIIVTNLFGHPAHLLQLRQWCDAHNIWMIEDNAQGILAKEGDYYAGTIGHIGVYSLNVHKHLQTGEGGVVVTNNLDLAYGVMDAINHGELRPGGRIGLNLRMTEPVAALAVAQLDRAYAITENRRQLALELNEMAEDLTAISVPHEDLHCKSAYYQWAIRVPSFQRAKFVENAGLMGLPLNCGYSPLLTDVFQCTDHTPVARYCEEHDLVTYEICAYNPTSKQRRLMRDVLAKALEEST